MLLLRSLRARLLIIGIVPVLAALIVTAVMTVRSVNQFSESQRYEARTQPPSACPARRCTTRSTM